MKKYLLFLAVVFFIALAPLAYGADESVFNVWRGTSGGGCNVPQYDPSTNVITNICTGCDIIKLISNIVTFLFTVAIPLAVVMIVYGGIRMIVAGGSEERVKSARQIITSAVIGLVIALAAWSIVNTTLHILTGDFNFPWNDITC